MRYECDFPTLPMPELRLYHSRKKMGKFLSKHGIPFERIETADAQTWTFHDETGQYAAVLYDNSMGNNFVQDMSILAHEATHVAIFALQDIGEEEPGEEQICYIVQAVCAWLFESHLDWKARKLAMLGKSGRQYEIGA